MTAPVRDDRPSAPSEATTPWEYLIVALPEFQAPTHVPGASDAIHRLNDEGDRGWEAVTMTALADGTVTVLFKRPIRITAPEATA